MMGQYVIRRILFTLPVFLGVSVLIFFFLRVAPGDIAHLMLGDSANRTAVAELRAQMGLDRPIYEQFAVWMGDILRGNFGNSFWTKQPVFPELTRRLPVTIELAVLAVLLSLGLGIPTGIICAIRQDRWIDYVTRIVTIIGLAVPTFWTGILTLTFLSIWFRWSPPLNYKSLLEDPVSNIQQYIVPAVVLGTFMMAVVSRMTRSMMLEVLRQDYIRTAWAKGLRERVVIFRHSLKNALIPVVTMVGNQFGALLGGTVIIEQIFSLPGVGKLTLFSIMNRDFPQVQLNVLFFAAVYTVTNLVVDLTYGFIDPRVRYQ